MRVGIIRGSLLLVGIFVAQLMVPSTASAINAADFEAGRIIDDALFYDKGGMSSIAEVQTFLNAHVPSCDTWGTRSSGYGSLNNAQYAQQVMGWPGPPYVCLNNYYENPDNGATSFENGGGPFNGGISAAQIIYDAAQQYNINPKVLLVMLRKESLNLFSDSWPLKSQYKYAMGYACPDSGPNYSANCQESKAGFYKQVNYSAWQLRYYYDHMGTYNYAPGRWNTIQYSTNPACGTKDVYIQNYATASLYIYTPYTPNDAALNAYPGTANCGAYGNRNFWFFWQEWFGTTKINGNFLRSPESATVYLVGDGKKYPIADANLLGAASRLGGVGYVSQSYLDTIPSGPLLGRFIQSPDGTIYYYDSSIKLPFTSCELVAAYGGACGSAAHLTQAQIDNFVSGPALTRNTKTISGRTFYIDSGKKREVYDSQSLSGIGLSTAGYNVLTDEALNTLQYGNPIIRNSVLVKNRQSSVTYLTVDGNLRLVTDTPAIKNAFLSLAQSSLDSLSLDKLTLGSVVSSLIKDEGSNVYLLTPDGKKLIPNAQSFPSNNVTTLPSQLISQLSGSGSLSNPSLVKSYDNDTVYAIVNGQKRPLVAMEDLKSITGQASPYIAWLSNDFINSIPTGNIIVGAGRLVKTPTSATVYMTDGYDKLIPMSTFDPALDMGVPLSIRVISDSILSKYSVDNTILSSYVSCGGNTYITIGGYLYPATLSGKTARVLQAQTCNVLSMRSVLPGFLLAPNGTIFQLQSGVIRPISSWSTYASLSASGGATIGATYSTLTLFTQGPIL
ncbi:MAG: hypothetical protein WBP12_04110 [Candidatus Saccharimonas sp.]